MKLQGAQVMVTGANRGIGFAFVEALLQAGAATVHAVGRDLENLETLSALDRDRIRPLALDVTDAFGIGDLAAATERLDLLINNAGVECPAPALAEDSLADMRRVMEVNYFGTLNMCRAFAPALQASSDAVVINVGSASALLGNGHAGYRAAAAAQLVLGQELRAEFSELGIRLVQVLAGNIDTDLASAADLPGEPPREVAAAALAALDSDESLVLPDRLAQQVVATLCQDRERALRDPQGSWARVLEQLRTA